MKIYVLLYHENSDCCDKAEVVYCGNSQNTARELLRDKYEKSLKALQHDMERNEDGYSCSGSTDYASIVEELDSYTWEITEHDVELPVVSVAIEVSDGLVQGVYSDGEHIISEVYDLDDKDDMDAVDEMEAELEEIKNNPDWHEI